MMVLKRKRRDVDKNQTIVCKLQINHWRRNRKLEHQSRDEMVNDAQRAAIERNCVSKHVEFYQWVFYLVITYTHLSMLLWCL